MDYSVASVQELGRGILYRQVVCHGRAKCLRIVPGVVDCFDHARDACHPDMVVVRLDLRCQVVPVIFAVPTNVNPVLVMGKDEEHRVRF